MSLVTLKKADLEAAAEAFGVDIDDDATKAVLLAALAEDGVTFEMYQEAFPEVEEKEDDEYTAPEAAPAAPAPVQKKSPSTLIKMARKNGTFEVRGFRFTREHPFVLVDDDNANFILENFKGFYVASPREAQEFYS